ncbi:aminoglycoside phosphotransferase family protein [Arthrobacter sp. H5]|uniref:aminoglycoside phosphotransferase family protein n=1 Tax=Arthrobacter sp. H5 TaxID=1267973 RepID=UPI000481F8CD|nr:aminoglycoside phosphotransferase family protein [Arthrobacter sp. H5]
MDPGDIELPDSLVRNAFNLQAGPAWKHSWQETARQHLLRWELVLDLPSGAKPWTGACAVVLPVVCSDGVPAVLKITIPHDEALPEPDALTLWDGQGAVALLESSKDQYVLLLERLDGDASLFDVPLEETAGIWGSLMRQLSIPPGAGPLWKDIPSVAEQAEQWTDTMPADWESLGRPFDRWLLEYALEVCQVHGAVGRRSNRDVLVHSDLHYLNILPRLDGHRTFTAIDPKPVVGDAEFALAPMLWNRIHDLSPGDPSGHLRERCSDLAFAAGLDAMLARDWSVVREVANALWYVRDGMPEDAHRSLWVASSLLRRTLPNLPSVSDLLRP